MQIEDEKLLRIKQQRGEQAIALAMEGRWQDAVEMNRTILELFPGEVDALNRLGRAYLELGDCGQAKDAYSRAIGVDPYNSIAKKNLQRLEYWKDNSRKTPEHTRVQPQHFIEEIGKSGVVGLHNPAPMEVLAGLVAGDPVMLRIEGTRLIADSVQGEYLGYVEPRHAQRLSRLMEGGNQYSAAVISVSASAMSIIIRETYQDPSLVGRLSFPPRGLEEVRPHAGDHVLTSDEGEAEDSGYTVIGGDEIEVLAGDSGGEDEDEQINEE